MTFAQRVNRLISQTVQVATPVDTNQGTLLFANDNFTTVRTGGLGGYGQTADVSILTRSVAYVRANG